MTGMPQTHMVSVRLPVEDVKAMDAEAQRLGITRTAWIERAVGAALGRPPQEPRASVSPRASSRDPVAWARQERLNKARDKRG